MKPKHLLIASATIALLSMAPSSFAGTLLHLTPTQVGSADSGGEYVWFTTTQAMSNPAGCASTDIYIIRTLPKNALAILLTAYAGGRNIRADVSDTTCDIAGRPLVTGVSIQD